MDALIARYSDRILYAAGEAAADKSISISERIVGTVLAMNISSSQEVFQHIHKPQNALMHWKIQKAVVSGLTPLLAAIVRDGIAQGLFNTPFPYECMEMLVSYANMVFDDDMISMTDEERVSRIKAFVFHAERMLGAESGSLRDMMQMFGESGGE